MTQAGTTCPTQAEDAIADAFSRSSAWQELTETADETEALAFIYFDSKPLPVDGHVFTLDELMERRVSMMMLVDPEEGITFTPGDAQGVVYIQTHHDIVVERWIRESEKSDVSINRQRELVDIMFSACDYATNYLLQTKGDHFLLEPLRMMPPVLNHYAETDIMGTWQQLTIKAITGGVPGGE